jgi:hypothetical protein
VQKIGVGQVVHDQVADFRLHFEEQHLVVDDMRVPQLTNVHEVILQEQDVLPVQMQYLHCVQLLLVLGIALLYDSVGALSDFFAYIVLVLEQRRVFLG